MSFNREIDIKEWRKIGDKLTEYFGICSCQRKLKMNLINSTNLANWHKTAINYTRCYNRPLIISRTWAMPSHHTFTIKPIAQLIAKYVGNGEGWIDPFAGENSPAEITNDLNPDKPAKFHLHAKKFAAQLTGKYRGVLFDPPYSLRQVKECYEKIGVKLLQEDTQRFPQNVKELISPKIENNGIAITFGWNSQGFGKNLGFEMIEILMIPHGRSHNDTIVTVERKVPTLF